MALMAHGLMEEGHFPIFYNYYQGCILYKLLKNVYLLYVVPLLKDLEKLLGERYKWISWGRDDGNFSGEFCPIFYRSDLFTVCCQRTE
jgi:hypothetical protein